MPYSRFSMDRWFSSTKQVGSKLDFMEFKISHLSFPIYLHNSSDDQFIFSKESSIGPRMSGVFSANDKAIVVGVSHGVMCFNFPSLDLRWETTGIAPVGVTTLHLQDNKVVVFSCENRSTRIIILDLNDGSILNQLGSLPTYLKPCEPKENSNICILRDSTHKGGLWSLDLVSAQINLIPFNKEFFRAVWSSQGSKVSLLTYKNEFYQLDLLSTKFSEGIFLPLAEKYRWTALREDKLGNVYLGGHSKDLLNYSLAKWCPKQMKTDLIWTASIREFFSEDLFKVFCSESETGILTYLEFVASLQWINEGKILLCALGGEGNGGFGDAGGCSVCLIDIQGRKLISRKFVDPRADTGCVGLFPVGNKQFVASVSSELWLVEIV